MNSNVSFKEKGKLLAAVAVLALVVCAFAIAVPSDEAYAVESPTPETTVSDLSGLTEALNGDYGVIGISAPISVESNLDLKGRTIVTGSGIILNGGTLSNGTIDGSGTNIVTMYSGAISDVDFQNFNIALVNTTTGFGTVTVTGCDFTAKEDGTSCSAIYLDLNNNDISFTIDGCNFYGGYTENALNLALYDGISASSVTVKNCSVSLNVYGPQSTTQDTNLVVGENLVLENTTVSNINLTQVDDQGAPATIVVEGENSLTAESITGTGSVQTDSPEKVDADVQVVMEDTATGSSIVSTYDALVSAIGGGATEITVSGTIDAEGNIYLDQVQLDMTGSTLNMGTYVLEMTNSSVTGGTITGVGESAANGGDFVIMMKYASTIEGTTISVSAPEGGILPYATVNVDPTCNGSITGVTFNAESTYDNYCAIAVQYYMNSNSFTIGGCTLNDGGAIMYNNGTNTGCTLTITGMDGITLNLLGSITSQNLVLDGTTVAETIVGWDASMASTNLGDQAVTNVTVNGDFDLGTISTGDDSRNGTQGMTVESGTVTANGGSLDALTIGQNGTFETSDLFEVDSLTIYDASKMPENLVPQSVTINNETQGRPVASDFVVVVYEPTYYSGLPQAPHYYIGRPSNVNATTVVDVTGDPLSQTEIGSYTSYLTVSVSYNLNNGTDIDTTTVNLTLNWEIVQGESTIDINTPQDSDVTVTDGADENTFIVNGELTYDDGYVLTIPGVTTDKNVVLTSDMFTGPEGFTFVEGSFVIALGDNVPSEIDFNVDFDGDAGTDNWFTSTYTLDLSGLILNRDAVIGVWDDGEDRTILLGPDGKESTTVDTADLYFGSGEYELTVVTTAQNTDDRYLYDAVFTGGLRYIDGADRYYLPVKVSGLLDGATVVINGENTEVVNGEATTILRVAENTFTAFWIVVDQDGDGTSYEPVTYRAEIINVMFESAVDISAGIQESYYGMPVGTLGDVDSVQEGTTVTFSGSLNYLSSYPGYGAGYVGWFLPWDVSTPIVGADIADATGSMNGYTNTGIQNNVTRINSTEGTFTVDLDGDGSKYIPAEYTFVYNLDCIAVGGYNEVGYDPENTDNAWQEMHDLGFVNIPTSDVAPQTMYIVFNTMGATEGTYTLQLNGEDLTIREGEDGWSSSGTAYATVVYFTFDSDNEHWNGNDIGVGTYTIGIVDTEGNELGTAQVPVGGLLGYGYDENASVVTQEMHDLGANVTDVIADTMYIVWNNDSAVDGEVTGYLYKQNETGGWDQIWTQSPAGDGSDVWKQPGIHSWYFSFNDQLASWAEENSIYGTYRMVIAVDGNVEGSAIFGVVDIIDTSEFTVYLDEGWFDFPDAESNEDVYDVTTVMYAGERLTLPGTAYQGMTIRWWALVDDSNEVIRTYNAGSMISIGSVPGVEGQEYHFVAVYAEDAPVSEHSIAYWISAALEYYYDGFDYTGSFSVSGTDIVAIYSPEQISSMDVGLMNDFARYMGAVYRASSGDIVSVYFDGTMYTWNTNGTLSGSNWVDADGKTLVSAVVDYVQNHADSLSKGSIALELTNSAGDRAVLNYGIGVYDSSSEQGYAKVRQLSDYYFEYTVDGDSITITVKTDLTDGYRNVMTTVMVSWSEMMSGTGNSIELFIDEPDEDGVVCQYTFTGITTGINFGSVEGYIANHYVPLSMMDESSTE